MKSGRPRPGSEAVGHVLTDGGILLRRAPAPARPRVPPSARWSWTAGDRLHRHQEPPGSSSPRTSRSWPAPSAATSASPSAEGPRQLPCLLRYKSFGVSRQLPPLRRDPLFRAVEDRAPRTETGDRGEVEDLPDGADFWREISAASENCIGQACPDFDPPAGSRACGSVRWKPTSSWSTITSSARTSR